MQASNELNARDLSAIERTTQEVGRYLFAHLTRERPTVFERRWWDDRLMNWAMEDESVKVQMFRFVDVLPMLATSSDVVTHLHEYFDEAQAHLPAAVRIALDAVAPDSLVGRAVALAARRNAMGQARRFIAGTTADEVLAAAMRQRKLRRAFTIDVLGEAVTSESEADRYLAAYLDLIRHAAPIANAWPEAPQIDRDLHGPLPRVNVSVKLSALDPRFDAIDPRGTTERVAQRFRQLLRTAREHRVFVNVDMESYALKDLTFDIFCEILGEEEFRHTTDVGIVIQGYLRDSEADLRRLIAWSRERGKPVWVRLVKGAYWDYETTHARQVGWPVPVFEQKQETDANFEQLTRLLLANHEHLRPAVASHNIRSLAHAIAVARHLGLPLSGFELQMLYGMGDAEKQVLTDLGHRVRIYMPYGELIPGMAYLVRRLLENTSNDSFLRASFTEHVSPEKLLMCPAEIPRGKVAAPQAAGMRPLEVTEEDRWPPFSNEPPTDFAREENRRAMHDALARVALTLPAYCPLVIGDRRVETGQTFTTSNPSHTSQVVGKIAAGRREHVDQAVAAAEQALPTWAARGAHARGELLRAVAANMRACRFDLMALIIYESGKTWREADADVAEAIDFCEYYARGAVQLERGGEVRVPGEENRFLYMPRGVTAVVAPWNFPLAILTGMTAAALATGNTVVMKPAEQTSLIGARLMDLFQDAGFPAGVVNYLPGRGDVVGAALVEHPRTALIVFTGSREVGLAINRRAAEVSGTADTPFVKRVIAEMGGKNAIVVDSDADLDEAVLGVLASAFGHQGQKCSACSRAIVLAPVYDAFLARLVDAARGLKIGPAEDPGTNVGPVIDEDALRKIRSYLELGRQEAREALAVDPATLSDEGFYVGPHIFADVAPDARLAQEEIFGPVLAVIKAQDFDEAIRLVNGTAYALTAGVYSRSPGNLARAAREILAGNLYLNRGITGALVGRQPFGGFKLSGIGSKAGGPDYLLQFVLPRTVTENTMRRGFAPSSEGE
ncbi:MAG: proline dehydrogenase family protein [Pirellulales bacterium]|nr:proline dehydrogenase family protein [Pirellulales bacterium]